MELLTHSHSRPSRKAGALVPGATVVRMGLQASTEGPANDLPRKDVQDDRKIHKFADEGCSGP
jgi:hypothetical protein